MSHAEAFPLSWPAGYPRTQSRTRSQFKPIGFQRACDQLLHELSLMGATNVILSTNQPIRKDGMPYANERLLKDPGVAVYFIRRGRGQVLACDCWDRIEHNIHALELSIASIRGLGRWGASDILERAFMGFMALPAPPGPPPKTCWEILEIPPWSSLAQIEVAYLALIRVAHPDRVGGSTERAQEITAARDEARDRKLRGVT